MRRDGTEASDGLRKDDTMTMEILVARSIRTGGPVTIRYACHHLKSIFWTVYRIRQPRKLERRRK